MGVSPAFKDTGNLRIEALFGRGVVLLTKYFPEFLKWFSIICEPRWCLVHKQQRNSVANKQAHKHTNATKINYTDNNKEESNKFKLIYPSLFLLCTLEYSLLDLRVALVKSR